MKIKYFAKLAWSGIKNNKSLYTPYILSSAGIICVYYIMLFLSSSPVLNGMFGARTSIYMLELGSNVLLVFSVIFLFYINTIVIKRRLKEFGLYNVLGMNKLSLSGIWACESTISSGVSILTGLISGIVFSKLAELIFFKMIHTETNFSFTFSLSALAQTTWYFLLLFFTIFLWSLITIKRSNPLDLMKSESVGEKPPRTNWIMAFVEIVLLAVAYFLAIFIKKPITVLPVFFLAAAMVIVAIYLLFTTASVVLCKILKNNKKYYYTSSHFISVSSMAYRMKRNGIGLASICILSTMVMVTGAASLYFGQKSLLDREYPQENIFTLEYNLLEETGENLINSAKTNFSETFAQYAILPIDVMTYKYATIIGNLSEGIFSVDRSTEVNKYEAENQIAFILLSDYNKILNTSVVLQKNELLVYPQYGIYDNSALTIEGMEFTIANKLDVFFDCINFSQNGVFTPVFVVNDKEYANLIEKLSKVISNNACTGGWFFGYELNNHEENPLSILEQTATKMYEMNKTSFSIYFGNKVSAEKDNMELFGGLLFFGILFSIVFICTTILIIYYKQLSEGYEDREKFKIMQKIGMAKKEIRKSINSQMITIFLLPVLFAALNLAIAIPMIYRLSNLFSFYNLPLIIIAASITCVLFVFLYAFVYKITSNTYFKLVSEHNRI